MSATWPWGDYGRGTAAESVRADEARAWGVGFVLVCTGKMHTQATTFTASRIGSLGRGSISLVCRAPDVKTLGTRDECTHPHSGPQGFTHGCHIKSSF